MNDKNIMIRSRTFQSINARKFSSTDNSIANPKIHQQLRKIKIDSLTNKIKEINTNEKQNSKNIKINYFEQNDNINLIQQAK